MGSRKNVRVAWSLPENCPRLGGRVLVRVCSRSYRGLQHDGPQNRPTNGRLTRSFQNTLSDNPPPNFPNLYQNNCSHDLPTNHSKSGISRATPFLNLRYPARWREEHAHGRFLHAQTASRSRSSFRVRSLTFDSHFALTSDGCFGKVMASSEPCDLRN